MGSRNSKGDFDFAPISSLDPPRIEQFAREVWPLDGDRKNVLESWWMTTGGDVATAAVERSSGRIAGLCVGVPSQWDVAGSLVSAVSICNWFVSPAFMGRGLGKALVQSFAPRAPYMNAFSVSVAAIENFRKLGWTGPYKSRLLLFPAPRLRTIWRRSSGEVSLETYRVQGPVLPPNLGDSLDQIDRERPAGQFRRRRRPEDWQAHLAYFPARQFDIQIVHRDGRAIGYFATRPADRFAGQIYRRARLHYVADLVINSDDFAIVRAILDAIVAVPAVHAAGAILLCTTDERIASTAAESGWWSHQTPLIGRRLKQKAPLYMKGDGFRSPAPDGRDLTLTFFDSDVDLNI